MSTLLRMSRSQIADFARSVRAELPVPTPCDVDLAILHLGGEVREQHDTTEPDACSTIERTQSGFRIVLAPVPDDTAQRRWVLAHLIGHLFLHQRYLINDVQWEDLPPYRDSVLHRWGYALEEDEAATFAAAFLTPLAEITKSVRRATRQDGKVAIRDVAEHFSLPRAGVLRAGRDAGLFRWDDPAMEVLW